MLKIPEALRTNFETKFSVAEIQTYTDIFDFIRDYCKALETFLESIKLKLYQATLLFQKTHPNSCISQNKSQPLSNTNRCTP